MATQTLDKLYARDVADTLGATHEVIVALIDAERRRGVVTVNGVIITHTGYAIGAAYFNAETAEYRLTWENTA